jgi:glycerol-3-phosphate acyltransferase PlsY
MLVGWCAVIGHNYSIFLGFKGGKGVAASFGTIAFLDIGLGIAILPLFIITVLVTRFTSAGSIIASASSVVLAIAMQREWWKVLMLGGLAVMIAFKHRDNLGRMYAGIERRIDQREPRVVSSDTAKPGSVDGLFKAETAEQISVSEPEKKPE